MSYPDVSKNACYHEHRSCVC